MTCPSDGVRQQSSLYDSCLWPSYRASCSPPCVAASTPRQHGASAERRLHVGKSRTLSNPRRHRRKHCTGLRWPRSARSTARSCQSSVQEDVDLGDRQGVMCHVGEGWEER